MINFSDLIKSSPHNFGVYKFISQSGDVIYVGKARDLNKRLASYTKPDLSYRMQAAVNLTKQVQWEICKNEAHALLLEAKHIKELQPRYNVLLKDDKTFPAIFIDMNHDFPAIRYFRGKQKPKSKYFGPFANSGHAKSALDTIKKATMIRGCADSDFSSRKRPCLEYQIKRCTAPCVRFVSKNEYSEQINNAILILQGKSDTVHKKLVEQMKMFIIADNFEKASLIQAKIEALTYIINSVKAGIKNDDPLIDYLQKNTTKKVSSLDDIPKIGIKRKQALLTHFGSIDAIKNAALTDITRVDGISKKIAKEIFDRFH